VTATLVGGPDGEADLLTRAAGLLPGLAGHAPVLACDVHTALVESAAAADPTAARREHLRSANRALDALVRYLVASGQAVPGGRPSQTLRGWLHRRDPSAVRRALLAAAEHCHPPATAPAVTEPAATEPVRTAPGWWLW
jgi:hypothetical protein